jgi:hypothetical protein
MLPIPPPRLTPTVSSPLSKKRRKIRMLRGSFEISCQACSSSSKTLASFKSPLSGLVSALPAESMRIDSLPTRPLGIPLQHPVYARARPPAAQHGGSPQIVCIPVSSLHALVTKAGARLRTCSGSPSFLRYRLPSVPKQSSISRPRRTWLRPRGNTSTSAGRPRRRRRHATTDLLCCCGSAARYWPV